MSQGHRKTVNDPARFQLMGIPNTMYHNILERTLSHVRNGDFPQTIIQSLYDSYVLSPELIHYFLNEATNIVKLTSLSSDDIIQIGEAYKKLSEEPTIIENVELAT